MDSETHRDFEMDSLIQERVEMDSEWRLISLVRSRAGVLCCLAAIIVCCCILVSSGFLSADVPDNIRIKSGDSLDAIHIEQGLAGDGAGFLPADMPDNTRIKSADMLDASHIEQGLARDGATYFFSIGDFGVAACETYCKSDVPETKRWGDPKCRAERQLALAKEMDRLSAGLRPSFIQSLGDNFYIRGVQSLEDPAFNTSFEDIYGTGSLQDIPWHIALGDHDHRGNVSALLLHSNRSSRWRLPRPFYSFKAEAPGSTAIEVLVTDYVGLEGAVDVPAGTASRRFAQDFSPEFAGRAAGEVQWRWLEAALARQATPALRIVVGHRPVVSAVSRDRTEHELATSRRLRALLSLAAERGPVIYLSGHDHALQHLQESSLHLVGVGAGGLNHHILAEGKALPIETQWAWNRTDGFVVHEIVGGKMTLYFVDASAHEVLYSFEVPLVGSRVRSKSQAHAYRGQIRRHDA